MPSGAGLDQPHAARNARGLALRAGEEEAGGVFTPFRQLDGVLIIAWEMVDHIPPDDRGIESLNRFRLADKQAIRMIAARMLFGVGGKLPIRRR